MNKEQSSNILEKMVKTVEFDETVNVNELYEAVRVAVETLRSDHFPDLTKMIPLTLERLREMDARPVWIEFEDGSGGLWGIVHISVFEQIVFPNGLHCTIGQPYYGKIYKAYAYPPTRAEAAEARAEKAERERDAAIKELDGVAAAVDDLSDFIDEQIHPLVQYDMYTAIRENADAISMWKYEAEWRGQKEE